MSFSTDEEIMAACIDLMLPNSGVSAVLAFMLANLVENPNVIRKCRDQIDQHVGRGRLPNLNDRQK